jgi:hypothetical protein
MRPINGGGSMRKINCLAVACLAAVAIVGFATAPASARTRLEVSTTTLLAAGRLTFFARSEGTTYEVICDVTLHGTTNRLISKVRGSLIGQVTSILTANARSPSGEAPSCMALTSLPMIGFYDSITGTLPNITGGSLRVSGGVLIGLRVSFVRARCLYLGELLLASATNPVRTVQVELLAPLSAELEPIGVCPSEGGVTGTMTVTPTVTIRLLEAR